MKIIDLMMKVKAPYNVNKLTSQAAIKGFSFLEEMQRKVDEIKSERATIVDQLNAIPQIEKVFPSDANFLLFRINDAQLVYKKMADQGVIIRYRGNEPHCENCLRMTIGTPAENELFFKALNSVISELN